MYSFPPSSCPGPCGLLAQVSKNNFRLGHLLIRVPGGTKGPNIGPKTGKDQQKGGHGTPSRGRFTSELGKARRRHARARRFNNPFAWRWRQGQSAPRWCSGPLSWKHSQRQHSASRLSAVRCWLEPYYRTLSAAGGKGSMCIYIYIYIYIYVYIYGSARK